MSIPCEKSADANDDGSLDLSDSVAVLAHLFLGAGGLPAPFPGCGVDPTDDPLTCEQSPSCPDSTPTGFLARLESRTVMALGPDLVGSVEGLDEDDFDFLGLTYDSASQELRGPSLPLSGKWLEVDGQRYMTDRDGYLRLPAEPKESPVPVYWHVDATEPVTVLESLTTVPDEEEPPVTSVPVRYTYPAHMDSGGHSDAGGGAGGICDVEQIPPGHPFTNSRACCEDYLGPAGDGKRYVRTPPCMPLAVRNYYGSLCYEWTFLKRGKPCLNEGAINHLGPGCWLNHKYRNCQNLDEDDFSMERPGATSDLAAFGLDVLLRIRNNTAANSTVIRVVPDAGTVRAPEGSLYRVVRDDSVGGWRIDHWNDGLEVHFGIVEVLYQPPVRDPRGHCVAGYRITASADGLEESIELRAIPTRLVWTGTATKTHIFDGLEEFDSYKFRKVTARIDAWDPGTDRIIGELNLEFETIDPPDCSGDAQGTAPLNEAPGMYFDFDFGRNPVAYEASSGSEDVLIPSVYICQTETGTEIFDDPISMETRWLDTVGDGVPRFLSADGCECRGTSVIQGIFDIFPTVYEWNLRMVPDGTVNG